jgi:hypothetical protein
MFFDCIIHTRFVWLCMMNDVLNCSWQSLHLNGNRGFPLQMNSCWSLLKLFLNCLTHFLHVTTEVVLFAWKHWSWSWCANYAYSSFGTQNTSICIVVICLTHLHLGWVICICLLCGDWIVVTSMLNSYQMIIVCNDGNMLCYSHIFM